jgi:hypothetical protein
MTFPFTLHVQEEPIACFEDVLDAVKEMKRNGPGALVLKEGREIARAVTFTVPKERGLH